MLFNEDDIKSIEENPVLGIVEACNIVLLRIDDIGAIHGWNNDTQELLWEAAYFFEIAIEANKLDYIVIVPEVDRDLKKNCDELYLLISNLKKNFESRALLLKANSYKTKYKNAFKSAFAYEFTQGDFDRIQSLVNELRDHISTNELLESEHKQRLLKRLENMQSELHKRVSDLDRFWGMIGDAGVVLGKLGKDAKPIVDRVKEIAEIVWKTQARTEELPSSSSNPMLDYDELDGNNDG